MQLINLLALLPLVLAAPSAVAPEPVVLAKRSGPPAPLIVPRDGAKLIKNKYVVMLKDGVSNAHVDAAVGMANSETSQIYKGALKGFASTLSADKLQDLLQLEDVDYIEQEQIYTTKAYVSQTGTTWGIARLSSKTTGKTTYTYDSTAGTGTCAYIIDTGIYTAHSEFGGRATFLYNAVDSNNVDGHGHGTHVAGITGSSTYGVAKATKLYAVKVLDANGSGTTSGVVAGINFVATDAKTRGCPAGAVANLSLGGGVSTTLNAAVRALVNAGVFVAVAAGNENQNAANTSPGGEPLVCTVAAATRTDAKASYSNYGTVVDVFGMGSDVTSTWIGSTTATNTISGTSMASPHIAGLGAYLLALLGPKTPAELCAYIASTANSGVLSGVPSGTVNKLAFNGNPSAT